MQNVCKTNGPTTIHFPITSSSLRLSFPQTLHSTPTTFDTQARYHGKDISAVLLCHCDCHSQFFLIDGILFIIAIQKLLHPR